MDKIKKDYLEEFFNTKDPEQARSSLGITGLDFQLFFDDGEFKKEYDKICDLIADLKFMELVAIGEKNSVLEYKKIQSKKTDVNEIQRIKEQTMEELIMVCDTRSEVLKRYIAIFDLSIQQAEKTYKKIIHERRLISPQDRAKKEEEENSLLLVEKFKRGELSEEDMYRRFIEIHLKDAEQAEYPSERQRATEKVMDIQVRLEAMAERKLKKERESDIAIADKVDALLLGCSTDDVIETSALITVNEDVD